MGRLCDILGALIGVVGAWAVSALLEPVGDCFVVFEGVIEAGPDLCLHQPIVDPLLCMVPLGPVPAQLLVSLFQLHFVERCLPQSVDVGLYSHVIEV